MFKFLIVLCSCISTCLYTQATVEPQPTSQENVSSVDPNFVPTFIPFAWGYTCDDPDTLIIAQHVIKHRRAGGHKISIKDLLNAQSFARNRATEIDVFGGPDRPEYTTCQKFIAYLETILEEERSKITITPQDLA